MDAEPGPVQIFQNPKKISEIANISGPSILNKGYSPCIAFTRRTILEKEE
jgi:hypothetical protein